MFLSYGKLAFYLAKFFSQPVKSLHANDAATEIVTNKKAPNINLALLEYCINSLN